MKINNVGDNDNGNKRENDLTYVYGVQFLMSTREGALAKELAEKLNDTKNIRYYISVALDHSERFLRDIYRKVQETPEHRIKKSRGALFAYLVKKYEHFDTDD